MDAEPRIVDHLLDVDHAEGMSRLELVARAKALRTINAIADSLLDATDPDEVLTRAVDAIAKYTHFPGVAIFGLNEAARRLELLSARGFSRETLEAARHLPLDGSLTGAAIRQRALVATDDVGHDARTVPSVGVRLSEEGFGSAASVPLVLGDDAIGAMNLIYKGELGLSPHERDMLMSIGKVIAIAIERARHLHRIETEIAERRRAEADRLKAEERQRALEEQLRQAQRIEGLGVLAGGIAHDFNNLLVGVLGNLSLARAQLRSARPEEIDELLDQAEKAASRSTLLARQLLTFASGGAPVKQSTRRLAEIVRDAAGFAASGANVRCDFDIAPDLAPVEIDAGQIAQVVQNLVINAKQAMPRGGTISVRARNADASAGEPAEGCVRIEVEDRGVGIAEEHLGRVFDPFFTTKAGGTGLGLATTYAIIAKHGGRVGVRSKVGEGTTFTIELPIARSEPSPRAPGPSSPPRGRGRVLVMDDEAGIRTILMALLGHLGYEATVTADGREAEEAFRRARDAGAPFDAVILDLTIAGGVGGLEAMQALRAIDPDVSAIVSSGYSSDAAMADYAKNGFRAVLQKPYTLSELADAIDRVVRERQRDR